MNASVNPQGDTDTVQFCYSTNSAAVTTSSCTGTKVTASTSPASGTSPVNESFNLTGLTAGTKYYYDLVVTSSGSTVYYGNPVETFTTTAATISVTQVMQSGGSGKYIFNGNVTGGGSVTVFVFSSYNLSTCTAGTAVSGSPLTGTVTGTTYSASQISLSASTTYYVKAVESSPSATSSVYSFTIPSNPPNNWTATPVATSC
jgi:hypothetical protein